MNDADIAKTAELLSQLQPGFLPYPIFEQVARLAALPVVEVIPLRRHEGRVEVLLINRGPNDPFWPNMLHTPGTIVRADDMQPGETKDWRAFERIKVDELKGTEIGDLQYVGSMFHQSKRGAEQAQLYFAEVLGEPKVGTFYDIADLPPTLIDSQVAFIGLAAKHFSDTARE